MPSPLQLVDTGRQIDLPITACSTSTQLSVHPMVKGAEDFRYQIWPVDETRNWDTHFRTVQFQQREWRVPSWDNWKILIRSTLDSMVGSGFWIGSELFELSKWKQDSARIKEEREQKKREYKLKEEAKKIEKGKKLGQEEKKMRKKKPIKAKTSGETAEGKKPGQEQKKCTKKKKKGKKKRKGGGSVKVEKKKVKKRKET
ncbi:hypothetical protein DDE82_007266 [Stemphylium lycopersici]|uniref:Uncharacterized protein n=1 Tax=Stemphylium lycopersici TaxID=183478 RepID=A0A364MSR8_STELY|nr:hypothetical protein DDE82_007266 [Stemphylium lycopersici]RAR02192.1 hypothetical protein DDE83_008655 [Stemphylium lycopersici]